MIFDKPGKLKDMIKSFPSTQPRILIRQQLSANASQKHDFFYILYNKCPKGNADANKYNVFLLKSAV